MTNLAESSKEGCGAKRAVLAMNNNNNNNLEIPFFPQRSML
jgi:hypothetical protein